MNSHNSLSSEAVRQARRAAHWRQEAAMAVTESYRSRCMREVVRCEQRALELAGHGGGEREWCPSRWMAASPVARALAGVILGAVAFMVPVAAQASDRCESFAELHWAMAEAVGVDSDAAYEDAIVQCEAEERRAPVCAWRELEQGSGAVRVCEAR